MSKNDRLDREDLTLFRWLMIEYPVQFLDLIKQSTLSYVDSISPSIGLVFHAENKQLLPEDIQDPLSIMGFVGEELSGFFGLSCDKNFLQKSAPVPLDSPEEESDWKKELLNQLLGAIKNTLLKYGIEFHASSPKIVSRQSFFLLEKTTNRVLEFYFVSDAQECLTVLVSAVFAHCFSLEKADSTNQALANPGTGSFF